jgi:hypothetical protein
MKAKHTFGVIPYKVDTKRIDFLFVEVEQLCGLNSCHKRSLATSYRDSDIFIILVQNFIVL